MCQRKCSGMLWQSVCLPTPSHYFQGAHGFQAREHFYFLKPDHKTIPRSHWRGINIHCFTRTAVGENETGPVSSNRVSSCPKPPCHIYTNVFGQVFSKPKNNKLNLKLVSSTSVSSGTFRGTLMDGGWQSSKEAETRVTKARKGEQIEMRSCDSLLCWWGESAAPKLSERFPNSSLSLLQRVR